MAAIQTAERVWQPAETQDLFAYESHEAQRHDESVLLAAEILDPSGLLIAEATRRVAERRILNALEFEGPDPMTDKLGSARLVQAHIESGRDAREAYANLEQETRTLLTENLLEAGHISRTFSEVNENGETVIGSVPNYELYLRAAHMGPEDARVAEIQQEFLSAALFCNKNLRSTRSMFVVSPSRSDTPGNTMMVSNIWFEQQPDHTWLREVDQLYVGNSRLDVAQELLSELYGRSIRPETEVDALNTVLLLDREGFPGGIVDIAQMLDAITEDVTEQPVFCGVPMKERPSKQKYEELPYVSLKRERDLALRTHEITQAALDIVASNKTSEQQQTAAFLEFVRAKVTLICDDHPEYAKAAFGEKAAREYMIAKQRFDAGDTAGASAARDRAHEASVTLTFCETTITFEQTILNESIYKDLIEMEARNKKRISPYASLKEKYPGKTFRGDCQSCSARRVELGPCTVCNNCDTKDKLNPGYITELMAKNKKQVFEQNESKLTDSSPTRLKTGRAYELGGQKYEYRTETVVGGSNEVFISGSAEIRNEAARALRQALELAA